MNIKDEVEKKINSIKDIIAHQDLVKHITKSKGKTYEDSYAYKLGLEVGLAHFQNLKDKIEKNENI